MNDGVDRVQFYLNGELLATDDTAPYEVTVDRWAVHSSPGWEEHRVRAGV